MATLTHGSDEVDGNSLAIINPNVETLTGAKTIAAADDQVNFLDPGGANRDVNLPAEANQLHFVIVNTADGDEDLVVKNDGGSTVVTLHQSEGAHLWSDGTNWFWLATTGGKV